MPTATAADPRLEALAERVGTLAHGALLAEVELTPKPGLVDRETSGAHHDMHLGTFYASAEALAPWFPAFCLAGARTRDEAPSRVLAALRPEGLACERAMFRATGGVNTHKGSIFSLGLLCAAAGRLGEEADAEALCREVAEACEGVVQAELQGAAKVRTAGERLFQAHGLTGARGEAASGFATVRRHALPAYRRTRERGGDETQALHEALLHLMAENPDTNVVSRGGMEGLAHVRAEAGRLIRAGGALRAGFTEELRALDRDFTIRWLSPGGSADLLAVTWFLARWEA